MRPTPEEHTKTTNGAVVVGFDGSEHSLATLRNAADEAAVRRVGLRVVLAQASETRRNGDMGGDATPDEVLDQARSLVAACHPELDVATDIIHATATQALLCASEGASLLVVGTRDKGGLSALVPGSIGARCATSAHCPVLIVRSAPGGEATTRSGSTIVVGIDGSREATAALRWALAEGERRSVPVRAVYAWFYPPVGSFIAGPRQGYEGMVARIVKAAEATAQEAAPGVRFECQDRISATVPALLAACADAQFLVVGATRSAVQKALRGSIGRECALHAPCPVVIVRGARQSEAHSLAE